MQWIAPSEKDTASATLEKQLWAAADQLRANSGLKAAEYSAPVLGLIFLRFAEARFALQRAKLELPSTSGRGAGGEGAAVPSRRGNRAEDPAAYHAEGMLYLPAEARFDHLLHLPEASNVGAKINDAMRAIEQQNPQLAGVLPKTYTIFGGTLLKQLLKKMSEIPISADYDTFGRVYEYFLAEFAMTEGQGGGEFYTPFSIVRLLTEVIEPYHGRILDPACGSGGMFVQSSHFIAISYYDDPHAATGRFDFVLANPPFNVNAVDKERLADAVGPGRRFPHGLPRTDNANYLWIQLFASALNATGRAGFVMANSASDARSSEQDIRQKLIESRVVDVMAAVGPNMFYTVTLPCTLWFFDKAKASPSKTPSPPPSPSGRGSAAADLPSTSGRGAGGEGAAPNRADTVLFIDARHIYRQVDRAHREWTPAQIGFIANLVRLYRGEAPDTTLGGDEAGAKLEEVFGSPSTPGRGTKGEGDPALLRYRDVPGLCRAASIQEIAQQGWSLNPGRYVGVAPGEAVSDEDFKTQLETLNEELETLNKQARALEQTIAANVAEILEA